MTRALVALLGLAIVIMVALMGAQAALSDAGADIDIVNETWTPNAGTFVALNHSNLPNASYDAQITVRDENSTLMDQDQDYVWNDTDGTIKAVAGGGLDGDANATITYAYQQSTEEQRTLATGIATLFGALGKILPMVAIIVVLLMLKGG